MGKSQSLNHYRIISSDLIWLREHMIWKTVIWFDLNLSWFDSWFKQITSLSRLTHTGGWTCQSSTQWSTTFAERQETVNQNNMLKTRTEQKLSAFCVILQFSQNLVLRSSETSRILQCKIVIWFDLIFGLNDLWFVGVIWDPICDLAQIFKSWSKDLWFSTKIWFEICPSLPNV